MFPFLNFLTFTLPKAFLRKTTPDYSAFGGFGGQALLKYSTTSLRIPQDKIDEVRQATDIIDVIGGFVKLKKRGKNFLGLCPFHTEKTPSFTVSSEKQMYHCFGCGDGGNVFTFVMEYEKVSFAEAVRSLAERANISLPTHSGDQSATADAANEQEQLYNVCRMAGLFFYHSLTETTEGKLALEYFHHRGFSDETIKKFGLGYSPNSWDALIKHFESEKVSIELLEKAGLVRKRDDAVPAEVSSPRRQGSYYDYYRGRAMFPIFSTTGRVVGFGARKLREDDPLGKYINSPETLIYNKSRILYGLHQSKDAIREHDFAILVEGYADLISVFQSGARNIVASSGTALTTEQIQLIGRYTKKITIVYDADSAGSKAALRGVDLILENDMDVRVAALPEGEDPDSYVKKNGGEAFQKLVDGAVSFIDFLAQTFERQGMLGTPEGQAQSVRTIVQSIAKISDELKRNFYIRDVAEKYKLYESTLYRELEKHISENKRQRRVQPEEQRTQTVQRDTVKASQNVVTEIPAVERDLIHAMLDGGSEIVKFVFEHLNVEDFHSPQTQQLASHLLHCKEEGIAVDATSLVNQVGEDLQRFISDLAFSKYHISKGWDERGSVIEMGDAQRIAADAIVAIKRRALEKILEDNQQKLKDASQKGEDVTRYMERHQKLMQQMKEIDVKNLVGTENS